MPQPGEKSDSNQSARALQRPHPRSGSRQGSGPSPGSQPVSAANSMRAAAGTPRRSTTAAAQQRCARSLAWPPVPTTRIHCKTRCLRSPAVIQCTR